MSTQDRYSDDEVRAIIDRALRDQPQRGLSHEELLAVASEVGIAPAAIEAAARDIREAREADEARQQILERRRRYFGSHLWTFLVVNACLFTVNFLTTPGQWWVLFPVVIWGMVLVFHARAALSRRVSDRAIRREQRRLARRERLDARAAYPGRHHAERIRFDSPAADAEAVRDEATPGRKTRGLP